MLAFFPPCSSLCSFFFFIFIFFLLMLLLLLLLFLPPTPFPSCRFETKWSDGSNGDKRNDNLPDVHAGTAQAAAFYDHGLNAKLAGGHAGRSQTTAPAAEDQVVDLLGYGGHDVSCGREVSRKVGEPGRGGSVGCPRRRGEDAGAGAASAGGGGW